MSNESKFVDDPRAIEIEEALFDYAEAVYNVKAYRRKYYKEGLPREKYRENQTTINLEDKSRRLYEIFFYKFEDYVKEMSSLEDKRLFSGRILWKIVKLYKNKMYRDINGNLYRKYKGKLNDQYDDEFYKAYGDKIYKDSKAHIYIDYNDRIKSLSLSDFVNEGLEAASRVVMFQDLTASDRMKFLLHLVKSGNYKRSKKVNGNTVMVFNPMALLKLSEITPKELVKIDVARLDAYRLGYLLTKNGKNKKELAMYLSMQHKFVDNLENLSVKDVKGIVRTYFAIIRNIEDKADKNLLKKLVDKVSTKDGKSVPNSEALEVIYAEYAEFERKNTKSSPEIKSMMYDLISYAADVHGYEHGDFAKLSMVVSSENGVKKSSVSLKRFACELNKKIYEYFANKSKEKMLKHKGVDRALPTKDYILEYTRDLYEYASYHIRENVKTDSLLYLLRRNAYEKGIGVKEATLFDDKRTVKPGVDKGLVLEVARIYGSTLDNVSFILDCRNKHFDLHMRNMFANIVATSGYKKSDIDDLKIAIIEGSEDKSCAETIANNITKSCILPKRSGKVH